MISAEPETVHCVQIRNGHHEEGRRYSNICWPQKNQIKKQNDELGFQKQNLGIRLFTNFSFPM